MKLDLLYKNDLGNAHTGMVPINRKCKPQTVTDPNSFSKSTGTDIAGIKKKKLGQKKEGPAYGVLWTSSGMSRPHNARHAQYMGFRSPPMY